MILVIPYRDVKIQQIVDKLQVYPPTNLVNGLETTEIHLLLPRFEIELTTDLVPVLQAVSINTYLM